MASSARVGKSGNASFTRAAVAVPKGISSWRDMVPRSHPSAHAQTACFQMIRRSATRSCAALRQSIASTSRPRQFSYCSQLFQILCSVLSFFACATSAVSFCVSSGPSSPPGICPLPAAFRLPFPFPFAAFFACATSTSPFSGSSVSSFSPPGVCPRPAALRLPLPLPFAAFFACASSLPSLLGSSVAFSPSSVSSSYFLAGKSMS